MGNFGQELRRERELRGVSLENIMGETKISSRHLLSLEEGQFGALPGGVLSKGIVRGYARAVGLDEEDCVSRYLSACRQSGLEKEEDASWTEFATNVGRNRKGEFEGHTGLQWAGVALLLTLLAVFGWYVAHFVQGRVSQAVFSPASVATVTAPAPTSAPSASPVQAAAQAPKSATDILEQQSPEPGATAAHESLPADSAPPGSTGADSGESALPPSPSPPPSSAPFSAPVAPAESAAAQVDPPAAS